MMPLVRNTGFAIWMVLILILLSPLWIVGVVFEALAGRKIGDRE